MPPAISNRAADRFRAPKVPLAICQATASTLISKGMYRLMTDEITWALCSWFEESGEHLIHPDDLDRIRRFNPFGVVFTVLTNDGEYTEIGAGAEKFRVRPETLRLIKPRESWIFELGEGVAIKGRNYNGTVVGIGWHHKEEKPTYRLKVAGKIKSKRYWPDDLQRLHLT